MSVPERSWECETRVSEPAKMTGRAVLARHAAAHMRNHARVCVSNTRAAHAVRARIAVHADRQRHGD
eukprot:1358193-Rhodomonas_salina.1